MSRALPLLALCQGFLLTNNVGFIAISGLVGVALARWNFPSSAARAGQAGRLGERAEPATRSKRNRRHSIGPFHIGTRRDSFSRIALGRRGSGLRIQAVQPAGCAV